LRRTEPDSIGFLERDAPLIFTSQYLVLEGAVGTRVSGLNPSGRRASGARTSRWSKKGLANHKFRDPNFSGPRGGRKRAR
jgi:uncharacterized ferredoxin-like protein